MARGPYLHLSRGSLIFRTCAYYQCSSIFNTWKLRTIVFVTAALKLTFFGVDFLNSLG